MSSGTEPLDASDPRVGARVRIVPAGKLIHVYYGKILVRSLAFDPDRRYQRQDRPGRR